MARAEASKSWQAANAKVEEFGQAFVSKLVSAGASKDQAEKVRRSKPARAWSACFVCACTHVRWPAKLGGATGAHRYRVAGRRRLWHNKLETVNG